MRASFGSCGGWDRTNDLQVMSLTSYHCSTPRYIFLSKSGAKVLLFFGMTKYFRTFFTFFLKTAGFPFAKNMLRGKLFHSSSHLTICV